jgi:hypothetical protein
MNSTPVSVTVRQAIRHGRMENPPSNDRPKPSGSSTVFAICMRAPALVKFTTQSMTEDVPRTIFALLSSRASGWIFDGPACKPCSTISSRGITREIPESP